jgi:hypothetical protein
MCREFKLDTLAKRTRGGNSSAAAIQRKALRRPGCNQASQQFAGKSPSIVSGAKASVVMRIPFQPQSRFKRTRSRRTTSVSPGSAPST